MQGNDIVTPHCSQYVIDAAAFKKCRTLFSEGRYENVEKMLKTIIDSGLMLKRIAKSKAEPSLEDAALLLSEALYRDNQQENCMVWLSESVKKGLITPENPHLHKLRAWLFIWRGEYRSAIQVAENALGSNQTENVSARSAQFYYALGMAHFYLGRHEKAQEFLRDAVGVFRVTNNHDGLASVFNALGFTEKTNGSLRLAIRYYRKALDVVNASKLEHRKVGVLFNLSVAEFKYGDVGRAIKRLGVCRDAPRASCRQRAYVSILLSRVLLSQMDNDSALSHGRAALLICEENGFPREESLSLETLGDIAAAQQKHDTAQRYYERAKAIGESIAPEGDLVAECMRRLASLRLMRGEAFESVPLLKEAISFAKKCGERFEIGIAYRHLSQAYRQLEQYQQAVGAARESVEVFTSMGARLELAHSRLEAARACRDWYHVLAGSLVVGACVENPNPYTHLETAWSHAIEAFHAYGDLDRPEGQAECEKLMDELHAEGRPVWLRGKRMPADGEMKINNKPFIATSPAMKQLIALVDVSAGTTEPVLVTGETGTGKELIARLIHEKSDRAKKPFVPINCAAIPETLFEREFFGHARGAFTGADDARPGLCEAADGGTMFLDEIGDMPAYLQVKLLRMLQEGTFHRLGDPAERRADLRIIAATNAPLPELIAAGSFRQDLYYRLQTLEMLLPPLRERPEDLDPLIRLFISKILGEEADPRDLFDRDVIKVLENYPWPGNVRELEAMTRRLALLARHSGRATLDMLPGDMRKWRNLKPSTAGSLHLGAYVEKVERERISQALLIKNGNRSEAARALGISRNQLYRKMEKFGIRMPV